MKYMIMLALVAVLGALIFAGVSMLRDGRDGKPKSNAMMRALADADIRLGPVKVGCWAGFVWVNFDPDCMPLEQYRPCPVERTA